MYTSIVAMKLNLTFLWKNPECWKYQGHETSTKESRRYKAELVK